MASQYFRMCLIGNTACNKTNCRVFHMCYGEGDIKWSSFFPNVPLSIV